MTHVKNYDKRSKGRMPHAALYSKRVEQLASNGGKKESTPCSVLSLEAETRIREGIW